MNVFEFLGLPAGHRPQGKVVQLVKNWEEVPKSKRQWPLIAQVKKDGVFAALVVKEDGAMIFGRTGKKLANCLHLEAEYARLNPGVYLAELCLPGQSLEVLSGIVNPNRTKPLDAMYSLYWHDNAVLHFHDYLTLAEFKEGKSDLSYLSRHMRLCHFVKPLPYVLVDNEEEAEAFAQDCIDAGEEGAVFKANLDYLAGHKGYRAMKKVRSVSYDLECIGVEEGEGKYAGKVANLIFRWRDGDTLKAMLGKGYSHQDATCMWLATEGMQFVHKHNPIGKTYRVYGLQDSSKGKIRLPKVGEVRHDKAAPDF